MIPKWTAIVLLILAASPVTAPFQTCDVVDLETRGETASVATATTAMFALPSGVTLGSLVPPLRTQSGHLKVVLTLGLIVTYSVSSSPTTWLRRSFTHRV
jgi:hypothetical protein